MNIFILDENPKIAAQMLCDKHIVKMIVESMQILMTVLYLKNGIENRKDFESKQDLVQSLTKDFPRETPYKLGYYRHPCVLWCLESDTNILWLLRHQKELLNQYTIRYNKTHSVQNIFDWYILNHSNYLDITQLRTKFALAMPEKYRCESSVVSYRLYYLFEKAKIAKWNFTKTPEWFEKFLPYKVMNLSLETITYNLERDYYKC